MGAPGVSRATIWEAHKAYKREILISIDAKKKKDRIRDMERTIKEIQDLEQKHKKA